MGLMFPKNPKKKKKKPHSVSVMPGDIKGVCYLCRKYAKVEKHHIFGGPNRWLSEKYGLTVYLCPDCHREKPWAVHNSAAQMRLLHREGQKVWEDTIGTREEFMKIFGRNYLEDKNDKKDEKN